jgi:protein-ribulosamine 3-kinase
MGEFESTSAIYAIVPEYTNYPIAWGAFKDVPDTYFYLCLFRTFSEALLEPSDFCAKLALLHHKSVSPNGKFGFHVVTYNGDLPQANNYTNTWEDCFTNGLKHMIKLNEERAGPSELQELEAAMCEKVIPRILRPLESHGRSVKPSLVHGDLWFGNTGIDIEIDKPIVFDPCCFYAHNECTYSPYPLQFYVID